MKKITIMAFLLAVFAPMTQVWGDTGGSTTYYASLKAQVSSNSSGMGKVYAGTSTTAGTYDASSSQTTAQSSTTQNENKTFYAFAQANDGYEFVGWSKSNNGSDLGQGTASGTAYRYTVTLQCSSTTSPNATTYYATFQKKVLPSFNITFETSSAGTYTVDGAAPANKTGLTEATSVTLASSDPNFLDWLVNGTAVSANPYTASCTANTTISAEFLTADQVASVTTLSELTSALSNAQYRKITLPSGTTIQIPKGTTVTVPSGKQLVVDGTLVVLGTVSNSGAISGNGTLYKISYLIDQGADELQIPCAPDGSEYGKISNTTYHSGESSRYYKTKVTSNTPSVGGTVTTKTTTWGVLLNGENVYAISAQSLKGVQVSLDTSIAANKITGIVGSLTTTNISEGETSGKKNWLLFADCSLKGPVRSDATTRLNFNGTIDLAGHTLTFGQPRTYSDFWGLYLNGTINFQPTTDCQNGGEIFFNCSSITVKNIKGTPTMLFYDCGTTASPATLTFGYQSGAHRNARFYGGCYNYSFNTSYDNSYAKVYGGSYSSDPSSYLADIDKLEAVKSGNYWVVQEKKEVVNVVQIGSTPYETLDAAIAAAVNGDTISLIEAVELTGTTTIPAGKSVTIALDGHGMTGGKIVNNGTLVFTDSTTGKGTAANEASGGKVENDIENNGTLDFVFGTYSGAIVNKAGTLTTHNGLFTGAFAKQGGTVNLKGGHFSANVEELATFEGTKVFFGNSLYSVCEVPNGTMYSETISSTAGYGATPYSDDDFALIDGWFKNSNARTGYTAANWTRLSELLCFYQLFNNNGLDATLAFDRAVVTNSLNLYAKSKLSLSIDLKFDLAAGQYYRALSETLIGNGYYSKTYKALWDDNIKSVGMAVSDKSGNNVGTVCAAMVELWESQKVNSSQRVTNTVYIAGQKLFTLGAGSNKAMIRPATGAATFYATPAAAMNAAANGGTVMLANDCDTAFPLTKAGTYTFDTMGFAHSDDVSVADGLFVKSTTSVDSSAKVLVADAVATTYVVAQKVASVGGTFYDNLTEAVANANGGVVTLLAATDETITLTAEGQAIQLTVADGVSFNDSQITTSAAGCSVDKTVSGNVATYTAMKKVAESAGASYPSVAAAIAASGDSEVSVTVTAATTENIELPQGKTLTVTVNDGVEAFVTVTPATGSFMVTTTSGCTTTYTAKQITVEMEEPASAASVEVTKIENGEETAVSGSVANDAIANLTGNANVPRTDNTGKLDVLKKITVTLSKIVLAANNSIAAATFDVTPEFNAGKELGAGETLKFRLPVDATATQPAAMIYHNGVFFCIASVASETVGSTAYKFLEIESGDFSPYGYELVESMVQVSDGFYQNAATYTASTDFYITSKAGLEYFRDLVNGVKTTVDGYVANYSTGTVANFYQGNVFRGKTVHLLVDIDLANEDWTPIGYVHSAATEDVYGYDKELFYGNFDGHNHAISNLNVVASSNNKKREYGLFGRIGAPSGDNQTFANLTIANVTVASGSYVGAFVGNCQSNPVTFDNCKVIGAISLNGDYTGAIYGIGSGTVVNSEVAGTSGSTISGVSFAGALVGSERGGTGLCVTNNTVSDVTVSSEQFAGGLVGAMANGASGTLMVLDNDSAATLSGSGATDAFICASDLSTTAMAVGTDAEFDENGKITGGVFTVVDAALVAEEYLPTENTDASTSASYPLTIGGPYAAKIVTTGYTTLAAALADVGENSPLTWASDEAWPSATPVYYNGSFYETLSAAISAANEANASTAALIYIKPNVTLGSTGGSHENIKTSITIYGDNASIYASGNTSGWEPTIEYPNSGGQYHTLTKDITFAIYNLHEGAGAWGARTSDYTATVILGNCTNAHEVLINGSSGSAATINNITIRNCTFVGSSAGGRASSCPVTTTNAGTVTMENCSFTDCNTDYPFNINNKTGGETVVNVSECTFTNCGTSTKAPFRLTGEAEGSTIVATVSDVTFSGTTAPSDIIVGNTTAAKNNANVSYSISGTAATMDVYDTGTGSGSEETTTLLAANTYTGDNVPPPPVAQVVTNNGATTNKYADLHEALEAGKAAGSVVTLLKSIDLDDEDWTPVGTASAPFYGSFDGNGYAISNLWVASENGDAGLFGYIGKIEVFGGTFKNLTLVNVSNYCDQNSAGNVGTLAGFANTTLISNITVKTASLSGRVEVAGLVGNAYCSTIKDCHLDDITIICDYGRSGGIAGQGYCTISGCSVTGLDLTCAWAAGGIIGLCNACTITDNYVQGALTADANYGDTYKIGGIVGCYNETANQTISGNYCNATVFNYQHSTIDYFPIVGMLNTDTPPATSIEALAENSWSREIFDTDSVGMANYDAGIPRDNNLIAIADDLQYVEAGDLSFVSASGITPESAAATINGADGDCYAVVNANGTVTVFAYAAARISSDGTTTNKYDTLSGAIAAAQAGDTIQLLTDVVWDGTGSYCQLNTAGNVTIDGKGHTLSAPATGGPTDSALLLGDSGWSTPQYTYTITNMTFSGFTGISHSVVRCQGVLANIVDCTFTGNASTGAEWGIVSANNGAALTVKDCVFSGNSGTKCIDVGFNVATGCSLDVDNCRFENNTLTGSGVIYVAGGVSSAAISDSTFAGNSIAASAAAVVYCSGTTEILGNLFTNNTVTATGKEGVIVLGSGSTGTVVNDNAFVDNMLSDGTTHATVYTGANCDLGGNYWGDGAVPETGANSDIYATGSSAATVTTYATTYTPNPSGNGTAVATVPAATYNVWVGGTQINSANAADVFGDGKVSYDDATKTLTLNGYTYSGAGYGDSAVYIGDVGGNAFTVVATNANSLTSTAAYGYAIRSVGTGAVTVKGAGDNASLSLTVPSTYDTGYAVSVKGTSATFKDLSMNVTGYLGFVVNGNNAAGDALTIDNCEIVFDGTAIDQAIWVYNNSGDGMVNIVNGSDLSGKGAILAYGYGTSGGDANVTIQDSTVTLTGATSANSAGRHAIEVLSNYGDSTLTIDNSTVTVTASNPLGSSGNGPDGINVGTQNSANGKGKAKIDIKNGSVVTATGKANGVNLFTWGDSVNPCGAEFTVTDSTLNASATDTTSGAYGIVAYAYQEGDTLVRFENSTINASANETAGICLGAGEAYNDKIGDLSFVSVGSDITTSGPYGLLVSAESTAGENTDAEQTVAITNGTFTCNGLVYVLGDGDDTASLTMSNVVATVVSVDDAGNAAITTGALNIDSGSYTITYDDQNSFAFDVATGNVSGGSFNMAVPEDLCADGYIPAAQDPVTGKYTVKQGAYVAQISDTKYETFAEAIAAADAAVAGGGEDPTITVLDATAELTNPDWKIVGNTLVRKHYVAQIVTNNGATTNKYESLETAYGDATNGDTIEMLADYRLSGQITFNKSVTLTGAVDTEGKPKYTIYGNPEVYLPPQLFVNSPSSPVDLTFQNLNFSEFGNELVAHAGYGFIYISKNSNASTHLMISNVTMSAFNCDAITAIRGDLELIDCVIDGAEAPGQLSYGIRIGNHDVALNPTLRAIRTEIRNIANDANWSGGAIIAGASSSVTLTDCTITNVSNGVTAIGQNQNAAAAATSVSIENTVIDATGWAFDIDQSGFDGHPVIPASIAVTSGMYAGKLRIGPEVAEKAAIAISGGEFDRAVPEAFCAAGFIPESHEVTEGGVTTTVYGVTPGYKVTFVNYDGTTELYTTNVVVGGTATYEGETPTKPGDATSAYAFSGWDPATMAAVTDADQTYTAQFAPAAAIAAVFEIAAGGATTNNYASYADLHAALEAGKAAGKTVALLTDIDLAGVAWTPVGTSASPFSGNIDGNGKVISNLTVNDPTLDCAGLIGYGNGDQSHPYRSFPRSFQSDASKSRVSNSSSNSQIRFRSASDFAPCISSAFTTPHVTISSLENVSIRA